MKLSFIIPLYNTEQYIGQCLDSVLNCDLDESQFEVIVVDDGSADNGLEIVNEYARNHPNIRAFHQENQGQSVARNFGINKAQGDYIWFVDSDDYVDATHISLIIDSMREQHIEICRFEMKVFRKDGSFWLNKANNVVYNREYVGEEVLINKIDVSSVCNALFLRHFIHNSKLSFSPGIIHEDSEFGVFSAALANRLIFINQCLYSYRYNEKSSNRSHAFEDKQKSHISDAVVSRNIYDFIDQDSNMSERLKIQLSNFAISIIKGRLVNYVLNKDGDALLLYKEFVEIAAALEVYPIKVRRANIKDKMSALFLNNSCLMINLIRLRNLF